MTNAGKQRLLDLIKKGHVEKAIEELLKTSLDSTKRMSAMALLIRFQNLRSDRHRGILNPQEDQITLNRILTSLLDLIESIPNREAKTEENNKIVQLEKKEQKKENKRKLVAFFEQQRKWKLGVFMCVLIIAIGGGIMLATTKTVEIGPSSPIKRCLSYQAQVTDQNGNPQIGLTARVKSKRIAPEKTNENGVFRLTEYLSSAEVSDTLELFRGEKCICSRPIHFSNFERIVLVYGQTGSITENAPRQICNTNESTSKVTTPIRIDSCDLIIKDVLEAIEIKGTIFIPGSSSPTKGASIGNRDIYVFVRRKECNIPIAEDSTDELGNYQLNIPIGSPYPYWIVMDGTAKGYIRDSQPYISRRQTFDYDLKKKK